LTLLVVGSLASQLGASGEPRASATLEAGHHVSEPAFTEATVRSDAGVQVRHLVAAGETFGGILQEHGLPAAEIRAWETAAEGAYDLSKLAAQQTIVLTFAKDVGRLTACDIELDRDALLDMDLVHGQIRARMKAMPRLAAVRAVATRVEASLATSASNAGVPVQMVTELADLFGWNVKEDVRPGDEFRIIYAEVRDEETGAERPGDILAAEVTSGGRTYAAIRFEDEGGEPEYYDLDGRPLGRPFLRYPVAFREISSGYSGSRLHPVLKQRRPHRGVDFSAPLGTPVRAVASGVVTFAGRNGRYGNHIEIQHDVPYSSSYSHLQRIVRGLDVGRPVRKGQVIGYVGRSGMATGPHLHFMLFENGEYIDPLSAKHPAEDQLSGDRLASFARLREEIVARFAALAEPQAIKSLLFPPASLADAIRTRVE
jgi:murein DD-endopeptidase MepM/ murein hydrolase activator NlpD